MVTLFIDTTNNTQITVMLRINDQNFLLRKEITQKRSQIVLPLIEEILTEHKKTWKDLTAIEVALGPGSFTGIRVGVSIANALGFALHVPVNGRKKSVEPIYK